MADSIEVENEELLTPRDFRRDFATKMAELEEGHVEKLVLMRGTEMTAVVIPLERFLELLKGEGAD